MQTNKLRARQPTRNNSKFKLENCVSELDNLGEACRALGLEILANKLDNIASDIDAVTREMD